MKLTKEEIAKIVSALPRIQFKAYCGKTLEFYDYENLDILSVQSDCDLITLMREISMRYIRIGQMQSELQTK